ncbi:NUDIX hydrolase [Parasulfuritortus cantonensis]|uniref:NUDIX hydrolase n=1 Tax=Parasulfuritortus cantonensis TaxID=2528202 RepID=A0A4R1BG35_9PROT|nr:NUDIX hydrolase [Parasulfuritortus cantonensis]TCJ16094.1 NUDIX hydrolase [Parasulfuritortus cantonensis]
MTATYHPKLRDNGQKVRINAPSEATTSNTWDDMTQIATCIPEGGCPDKLNAVGMSPVSLSAADLNRLAYGRQFSEPEFSCPKGYEPAAGAVVVEPDGRVWLVHPTNEYGGYSCTFPKGRTHGEPLREAAIREVLEEAGLLVELLDFLADSKRSETYTRYYLARRIGGTPSEMGWESQAVSLAPSGLLTKLLNRTVDHKVAEALADRCEQWREWFRDEDWLAQHARKIFHEDNQYGLTSAYRILYTIDAFRERYGLWPTVVSMDAGMYGAIPEAVLSPFGWRCLEDRVKVDGLAYGTVVAYDDAGRSFDYAEYDHGRHSPAKVADVWIWGIPM